MTTINSSIPLGINDPGFDPAAAFQKGFALRQTVQNAPLERQKLQNQVETGQIQNQTEGLASASAKVKALQDAAVNLTADNYSIQKNLLESHGIVPPGIMPPQFDPQWKDGIINKLSQQAQQLDLQTKQAEIGLKGAQAQYYQNGGKQPAAAMLARDLEEARLSGNLTRYNELAAAAKLLDKGQLYNFSTNSQTNASQNPTTPNSLGGLQPPQVGALPTITTMPGYNSAVGGKEAAKEQAKLDVKTGAEANASEETFSKLNQNLDAMEALVKGGTTPSSKYFVPASVQASLGRNIPQLGMEGTAKGYTDFNTLNTPVVLNTLAELVKGGAIRGNQTVERMINQGFLVDPNLSDQEKLDKIATIRSELQNAAIASRNISNKDKGQPTQLYQGMPTVPNGNLYNTNKPTGSEKAAAQLDAYTQAKAAIAAGAPRAKVEQRLLQNGYDIKKLGL